MLAEEKQQTADYKECTIDERLEKKMGEGGLAESRSETRQERKVRKRTNARIRGVWRRKKGAASFKSCLEVLGHLLMINGPRKCRGAEG
jgi:hypothetical protein